MGALTPLWWRSEGWGRCFQQDSFQIIPLPSFSTQTVFVFPKNRKKPQTSSKLPNWKNNWSLWGFFQNIDLHNQLPPITENLVVPMVTEWSGSFKLRPHAGEHPISHRRSCSLVEEQKTPTNQSPQTIMWPLTDAARKFERFTCCPKQRWPPQTFRALPQPPEVMWPRVLQVKTNISRVHLSAAGESRWGERTWDHFTFIQIMIEIWTRLKSSSSASPHEQELWSSASEQDFISQINSFTLHSLLKSMRKEHKRGWRLNLITFACLCLRARLWWVAC